MVVLVVQDMNGLSARRDLQLWLLKHHCHMFVVIIKLC